MGHEHNADPARGPVCSHLVTEATLAGWGYVTEKFEKIVGTKVCVREGWDPAAARRDAWDAGMVRCCVREPAVMPGWAPDPAHVADAIAWAEAHIRPQDRRRSAA